MAVGREVVGGVFEAERMHDVGEFIKHVDAFEPLEVAEGFGGGQAMALAKFTDSGYDVLYFILSVVVHIQQSFRDKVST